MELTIPPALTLPLTWIDFLLDESLLLKHFQNENPEPSVLDLLKQFLEHRVKPPPDVEPVKMDTTSESEVDTEAQGGTDDHPPPPPPMDPNYAKKLESLKLLAVQTAAHLNWDLDILAKLPLDLQMTFMDDLKDDYIEKNEFLASVFHRWVIRSRQAHLKTDFVKHPLLDLLRQSYKKKESLDFLENLIEKIAAVEMLKIPIPLTFKSKPNPPDFDIGIDLRVPEFISMLHIELGIYFLYKNVPIRAKGHFEGHNRHSAQAPEWGVDKTPYFQINPAKLKGFMLAVGVGVGISKPSQSQSQPQRKIQKVEVPTVSKVKAILTTQVKTLEKEVQASERIGQQMRECDLEKLQTSLGLPENANLYEKEMEIKELDMKQVDTDTVTVKIEETIRLMRRHLVETGVKMEVKNLLAKLFVATKGEISSFAKVFPIQDLPNALKKAIDKLPDGQIKDFVYIAVAKSKISFNMKMFQDARTWLHSARSELSNEMNNQSGGNGNMQNPGFNPLVQANANPYLVDLNRVFKILRWENLLVEIGRLFEEWPARGNEPIGLLCKEFLKNFARPGFQANPAIAENVLMALINVEEYETVVQFDVKQQKWTFLEFLVLLATACSDFKEKKESASSYRGLWNAVLPIFYVNEAKGKAGLLANRSAMTWVLERCKSETLVSLFVSLLVRLHNHVVDDVALQIRTDFIHIWPNILDDVTTSTEYKVRAKGGSKLNIVQIRDTILTLLHHPSIDEKMWLKCIGDVHLSAENFALALKSYLEYFSLMTDGFENPQSETWKDEYMLTKMIKCCELLEAYTEALILMQFLPVVDYTKAFGVVHKSLGVSNDSSDAMYGFIWDFTILECIINGHKVRKQIGKMELGIQQMSVLELNPNNAEDDSVYQGTLQLRKARFMRTLANRYVFAS